MAKLENEPQAFDAKVNVNVSIPTYLFAELKAVNQKLFEGMRESNPDITRMPEQMKMITLNAGTVIKISEAPEVREDGAVFSYPVKVFEVYSKRFLEAPNPIKGEVQPMVEGKNLVGVPQDIKDEIVAKMKSRQLGSRFINTPYMEKVV